MMNNPIDFYFDFSSPYSYLASEKIDQLAAKYGRKVRWRPILIGSIFQKLGSALIVQMPLKGEYSIRDFSRSARFLEVPFKFPSVFPRATQHAARTYYYLHEKDCKLAREFAHRIFRGFFAHDVDISSIDVVLDIATEIAGQLAIDRATLLAEISTSSAKERPKVETESAFAQGVFGVPYIVIDGEPFWGADRLPQIEKWLANGGF